MKLFSVSGQMKFRWPQPASEGKDKPEMHITQHLPRDFSMIACFGKSAPTNNLNLDECHFGNQFMFLCFLFRGAHNTSRNSCINYLRCRFHDVDSNDVDPKKKKPQKKNPPTKLASNLRKVIMPGKVKVDTIVSLSRPE